ncbi:oxidoreductase, FAD/FMN-binding superfamily [Verrucomicrobiia bacterium DG1235]|nr:oxidoreductase, FAD/FMN-binding superfamily [Verrucomicrobiae bacterium DG1235]
MKQTLFASLSLGETTLRNRIAFAPLTRTRAEPDGTPSALMAEHYAQRASAGLLIAEATAIASDAIAWLGMPGIFSESQVAGWKKVTDAVHAKGGTIFLQIWHPGRATHSLLNSGTRPVAPSPIAITSDEIHTLEGKKPYETPRALEEDEIPDFVNQFKRAAKHAKEANFDGVEIHAANGYLIDQFLQSASNHRQDAYGGSIEKRYRFLDEVVKSVLEVFPAKQIGVRLSPNGNFNDMGSDDYREQFAYTARQLETYDLGYLHVIDGLGFGFHEKGEAMTLEEFRPLYSGVLMGNCGYTKESAEERIEAGHADMIAFGRPFMSNPDLVERFANDWALNPEVDQSQWYGSPSPQGYTDQPTAQEAGIA